MREFSKLYDDYANAVKDATIYCIANDVLAEFLREYGGEIVSILTMEYDEEAARKVWREEAIEEERIEIAKKLLDAGDSIDKIVMITGLTRNEVENLSG